MPPHETRLTVLISGNGSNLQALIDAIAAGSLPHTTIVRVISNRKSAHGLVRAERAGIPTDVHTLLPYKKAHPAPSMTTAATTSAAPNPSSSGPASPAARMAYDEALAQLVLADKPTLVLMAGFMHIVSSSFLGPLRLADPPVPCLNLHPALPGAYVGADGIGDAWRRFQEGTLEGGKTGVMVHEVVEEVDRGEAVVVREIEMRVGEGREEFEKRVHAIEHEVVVEAVKEAARRWRTGG
ncbi:MAG: hypothetical protein M1821_003155 [Bathelium mastoideum]|nr:MAG: hypothetical protein M1821_003155 [Bathelium mastoideum]